MNAFYSPTESRDNAGVTPVSSPLPEEDFARFYRRLCQAGLLALSRGMFRHAESIFEGAKSLAPNLPGGGIGLAHIRFLKGDPAGAIQIYEDMLARWPDSALAKTLLGMILATVDRGAEGAQLLTEIATSERPEDQVAKDLAQRALNEWHWTDRPGGGGGA